jgi:DNA-binding MarR family transcriptional regulator
MQAPVPLPPTPTTEEAHAAIGVLGRLAELFQHRREQLAGGVGLTDQQWGVLEQIATEHFMPSLFARQRDSSAAAVSKILRQLVDKDLISVSISKTDGRQRQYDLTPRGKRLLGRLRRQRQDAIAVVWLAFDAKRLRTFTELGSELIERLEAYAREAENRK